MGRAKRILNHLNQPGRFESILVLTTNKGGQWMQYGEQSVDAKSRKKVSKYIDNSRDNGRKDKKT